MWRFGRYSERKNRKSPFTMTPLSCDAPFLANPANIHINLTLVETRIPGLQFCRWQYVGSSSSFRTVSFVRKPEMPTHYLPSPKQIWTQNGHSRSFKVIYFGTIEEPQPLMGYIAQYNKCCLRCEGSEDIASERTENLHFRPPHSHLSPPLQRTPSNIRIKLNLLETGIPGLHFCRW